MPVGLPLRRRRRTLHGRRRLGSVSGAGGSHLLFRAGCGRRFMHIGLMYFRAWSRSRLMHLRPRSGRRRNGTGRRAHFVTHGRGMIFRIGRGTGLRRKTTGKQEKASCGNRQSTHVITSDRYRNSCDMPGAEKVRPALRGARTVSPGSGHAAADDKQQKELPAMQKKPCRFSRPEGKKAPPEGCRRKGLLLSLHSPAGTGSTSSRTPVRMIIGRRRPVPAGMVVARAFIVMRRRHSAACQSKTYAEKRDKTKTNHENSFCFHKLRSRTLEGRRGLQAAFGSVFQRHVAAVHTGHAAGDGQAEAGSAGTAVA